MTNIKLSITMMALVLLSACAATPVAEQNASADTWAKYLASTTAKTPFIDFSRAGVNYSETGIPDPDLPVFNVVDYGAVANDELEDRQAIQDAIHAAEQAGGGIVLFPKGKFLLNEQTGRMQGITISHSNIILRGSGSEEGETELFMKYPLDSATPKKMWTTPPMLSFLGDTENKNIAETSITEDSSFGSNYVTVSDAGGFKVNDMVSLKMQSVSANEHYLQGKKTRDIWHSINEEGVEIAELHQVTSIQENRLYFANPILVEIKSDDDWQVHSVPSIVGVGLEDITFTGNFHEDFVHHKSIVHDSGYTAVKLDGTMHSWVKNCRFVNVSSAVTLHRGLANSALLNIIEGNRGHNSFAVTFGTRNLVGLNIDRTNKGQWHGPGASHFSVGNVFWRFESPASRGIDAHAGYPRHTLFDKLSSYGFGGWGGNYKNLPNHLEGMVFWNFKHTGPNKDAHDEEILNFWNIDLPDTNKYGYLTAVNPVLVGYEGPIKEVNQDNVSIVESMGEHVLPVSLYEAQLKKRLGKIPGWVEDGLKQWQQR